MAEKPKWYSPLVASTTRNPAVLAAILQSGNNDEVTAAAARNPAAPRYAVAQVAPVQAAPAAEAARERRAAYERQYVNSPPQSELHDFIATLLFMAIMGLPLLLVAWFGSIPATHMREFEAKYPGMVDSEHLYRLAHHHDGPVVSKEAALEFEAVFHGKMPLANARALAKCCDAEVYRKFCEAAKTGWETK